MKAKKSTPAQRLPYNDSHWVLELVFHDFDYHAQCPRCSRPCEWLARIRIDARSLIQRIQIHCPLCPCPEDHIRQAVAEIVVEAAMKQEGYEKGWDGTYRYVGPKGE